MAASIRRRAELTSPPAPAGDLDDPVARGPLDRWDEFDRDLAAVDLLREGLPGGGLLEDVEDGQLSLSVDEHVDAEFLDLTGVTDLPGARPAKNDRRVVPPKGGVLHDPPKLDRVHAFAGHRDHRVVRHGYVREAHRVHRRDPDDLRLRADELLEVVGVAANDVLPRKMPQEKGLHLPEA